MRYEQGKVSRTTVYEDFGDEYNNFFILTTVVWHTYIHSECVMNDTDISDIGTSHILRERVDITDMSLSSKTYSIYQKDTEISINSNTNLENFIQQLRSHIYDILYHNDNIQKTPYIIANIFLTNIDMRCIVVNFECIYIYTYIYIYIYIYIGRYVYKNDTIQYK